MASIWCLNVDDQIIRGNEIEFWPPSPHSTIPAAAKPLPCPALLCSVWQVGGASMMLIRLTLLVKTVVEVVFWFLYHIEAFLFPKPKVETIYYRKLAKALSWESYEEAAKSLDILRSRQMWKGNPASPLYDYKLIQARLDKTNELLSSGTPSEIIFFLRSGAIRSLGGLCHPTLLKYCAAGTKTLIEAYVGGVIALLKRLDSFSPPPPPVFRPSEATAASFSEPEDEAQRMGLDQQVRTNFYGEMLQGFGRTALVLHGGASFGLCHLGVAKALHAQGLLPKIICGSYIGALVASHICVQPPEHLAEALTGARADLAAFRRVGPHALSFRRKAVRFLKYGHVFDVRIIEEAAKASIGAEVTFREAFRTSGRILNIVVYSRGEMPVLLNYLTTPDVLVWTAACASCAVPGLYEEVMLLRKDEKGGIGPWNPSAIRLQAATVVQEIPLTRLTELFNANNFIISHIPSFWAARIASSDEYEGSIIDHLISFASGEIKHRLNQLSAIGLMPAWLRRLVTFFSSPDVGDIQIVPPILFSDLSHLSSSLTAEHIGYCVQKGERAVWRRMTMVKMRCAIEFAIDELLAKSRQRVTSGLLASRVSIQM